MTSSVTKGECYAVLFGLSGRSYGVNIYGIMKRRVKHNAAYLRISVETTGEQGNTVSMRPAI